MTPNRLLDYFDRISEAPDALPRLRRFILDLAVRGKLVEQDPNDEPASELLKRIQAEKARLVKAGEIRKEKPLPLVERDEGPFDAPAGWKWVRVRQVTSDRGQTTPDKDFTYIDVTSINKEVGCVADAKILSAGEAPSRARKLVRTGDVLYSCVRPYLLNIAVIESDIVPSPIASTAFAVLNGFGLVLSKYLWIALRSPFMVECVEAKMRGQAYPAINDSDFALLPLPLPPLAEQHRIVAKADELMALCDRLEAAQTERESRRDKLVAASLHRLNNGADAESFREHARFHFGHLPRLTTHPEHLQQLRQTILNLAVRGKLVPQNPNDEPASKLLKQIQAEKQQLLTAGKFKKQKLLPPIGSDERPFNVPSLWEWCRLGETVLLLGGYAYESGSYVAASKNQVIRLGNVKNNRFLLDQKPVFITDSLADQTDAFRIVPNDILLTMTGTKAKRDYAFTCIVRASQLRDKRLYLNQRVGAIRPVLTELVLLLNVFLKSEPLLDCIFATATGTANQANIGTECVLNLPFPLPPLSEQHRIVAKVDELMVLCDRLEAQLTTTQTESRCLLDAVLHEALERK